MTETPNRPAPCVAVRGALFGALLLSSLSLGACTSQALEQNAGSGGGGGAPSSNGGSAGTSGSPARAGNGSGSGCSAALRQALTLVDQVTPGTVTVLQENGGDRVLYVDASTGGIGGQDIHPWVYLSLRTGKRVDITDLQALSSTAWDLALKRSVLRSNSGDSGPGAGGAARSTQSWPQLTLASASSIPLSVETWFDPDCTLLTDAAGSVLTTFSDWSLYDESTHTLIPALWPYVVRGADGALYKLAVLDYYSKPDGTSGASDGGHYKLHVAALE